MCVEDNVTLNRITRRQNQKMERNRLQIVGEGAKSAFDYSLLDFCCLNHYLVVIIFLIWKGCNLIFKVSVLVY